MDDDLREQLAEELRSVASAMLTDLSIPFDEMQAFDQLRARVLDVAFRLDPRDEKQRATGR